MISPTKLNEKDIFIIALSMWIGCISGAIGGVVVSICSIAGCGIETIIFLIIIGFGCLFVFLSLYQHFKK